jgi:methylmalonyl-CoA mutase C-terminal domain/subunit
MDKGRTVKSEKRNVRILLAKPGLDGHDRGIHLVARALRDAGIEVIFLGLQVTPTQIVRAVIQEDVDVIGLSTFSGGHMTLIPRIIDNLRDEGLSDLPVIVGGIIPPGDVEALKRMGVRKVFIPGSSTSEIVSFVCSLARPT